MAELNSEETDFDKGSDEKSEQSLENKEGLGCEHYKRGCSLKCPDCEEYHTCRFCHNEKWEYYKDIKKQHIIDKQRVENIRCLECNEEQPVSNECIKCKLKFGEYYCEKCVFWDNDLSKEIFHCDDCKLCRVGGKENFQHCDNCGMCLLKSKFEEHNCRVSTFDGECPICFEDLKTSTEQLSLLRCTHVLHEKCLLDYLQHQNLQCPLCKKFIYDITSQNIQICTRQIDLINQSIVVPEELQRKINIKCYECGKVENDVDWSPYGNKCTDCNVYNTFELH